MPVDFEREIRLLNSQSAMKAIDIANYVQSTRKSPWHKAELIILTSMRAEAIVTYAKGAYPSGWKAGEEFLLRIKDVSELYRYARQVRHGPWPEAEPHIARSQHIHIPISYAQLTRSRFPLFEERLKEQLDRAMEKDKTNIRQHYGMYQDTLVQYGIETPALENVGRLRDRKSSASRSALAECKRSDMKPEATKKQAMQLAWTF